MKNINIPLEDAEFEQLDKVRGDMTWRDFVLQWIRPKEKKR